MSAALFELKQENSGGAKETPILDATRDAFAKLRDAGLLDAVQEMRRVVLERTAEMLDEQFSSGRLSVAMSNTLKLVLEELNNLPMQSSGDESEDALDIAMDRLTREAFEEASQAAADPWEVPDVD